MDRRDPPHAVAELSNVRLLRNRKCRSLSSQRRLSGILSDGRKSGAACSHCNSGKKGRTFRGVTPNERFLHPYFDSLAGQPLWLTRIIPPFKAAQFEAVPIHGLNADTNKLVKFHLRHVLGPQFHRNAENLWATYPQYLRDEVGGATPVLAVRARKEIDRSLRTSILTLGQNSWNASFFRGLSDDNEAKKFLAHAARNLKARPLPS